MEKGYAYEVNGSVYFDVLKYNEKYKYGKLQDVFLKSFRAIPGTLKDRMKNGIHSILHSGKKQLLNIL